MRERLFELLPRDGVDLLDGVLRVLDGLQQVLPLRLQELVALRRLLVFLQRHHVHRAHVVQPRAHLAIGALFVRQLLRRDAGQRLVGHELIALLAKLLHAGFGHVLRVRLHAGLRGRKLAAPVASGIERFAGRLQRLFQFRKAHRERLAILPAARDRVSAPASRSDVHAIHLLGQANVLGFALLLLSRRRIQLRLQLGEMRRNLRDHGLDALHGEHGAAAPLFQRRDCGAYFAGQLRRFIAALAQRFQAALRCLHLGFERTLLFLAVPKLGHSARR